MRFLILFIILFFGKLNSFGQCDTTIIGEWKIVSVFNGQIYINFKTDSVLVTSKAKLSFSDTSALNSFISIAKDIYRADRFVFEKDGVYKTLEGGYNADVGIYCFKQKDNMLQLTSKELYGKVMQEVKSKLDNGLLYIFGIFTGATLDLILEKSR